MKRTRNNENSIVMRTSSSPMVISSQNGARNIQTNPGMSCGRKQGHLQRTMNEKVQEPTSSFHWPKIKLLELQKCNRLKLTEYLKPMNSL